MGKSKIIYGGSVLIDLTGDTITDDVLLTGYSAHGADGEPLIGACPFDVDSSGATAAVAEVLISKTFAKGGKVLTGTMPNNGAKTIKITTKEDKPSIDKGFHDGSGHAEIDETERAKLIPDNIREGVTILGVAGAMSGTEDAVPQAKTVTPKTTAQEILPDAGYNFLSQVTVEPIPYVETENNAGGITVTIG